MAALGLFSILIVPVILKRWRWELLLYYLYPSFPIFCPLILCFICGKLKMALIAVFLLYLYPLLIVCSPCKVIFLVLNRWRHKYVCNYLYPLLIIFYPFFLCFIYGILKMALITVFLLYLYPLLIICSPCFFQSSAVISKLVRFK